MLDAYSYLLFSKLCRHNPPKPTVFRAEARAGRKLKTAQAAKLNKRKSGLSKKPQLGLDPGTAGSLSTGTQQIVRASWPRAS